MERARLDTAEPAARSDQQIGRRFVNATGATNREDRLGVAQTAGERPSFIHAARENADGFPATGDGPSKGGAAVQRQGRQAKRIVARRTRKTSEEIIARRRHVRAALLAAGRRRWGNSIPAATTFENGKVFRHRERW